MIYEEKARAIWPIVELIPMDNGTTKIAFGHLGKEFQYILDDRIPKGATLTNSRYREQIKEHAWACVYRSHPEAKNE